MKGAFIVNTYSETAPVTLLLELDEDGCLELIECYDESGSIEAQDGSGKGLTNVGWVLEEWSSAGIDMLCDATDDMHFSEKLKIKGRMWCDGPDCCGEWDSGFKIDEVLEHIPAAKGFCIKYEGENCIEVPNCPHCKEKHILTDTNRAVIEYECGEKTIKAIIQ